jgi:monoamine oxidase
MRPRYILPIDAKKGVIMISYTDADDSKTYSKLQTTGGDKVLEATIMADVRTLFPDRKIPKPTFFRSHPWSIGATYWLPGSYSPAKESESACHPLPRVLPGVFLCGESWSLRQAWVEGALEHTQQCFQKLVRLIE